ncbi:MAG: glutamine amidotransferase [Planctomycetota bacterium]
MFEAIFKYPLDTFGRGRLVYLSGIPGEIRFLLLVGAVALAWFLYKKVAAKLERRPRRVLLGLRIATSAIVLFILGMPALQVATPRERSHFTAVLVDTSRSMSIEDEGAEGAPRSRLDAARGTIEGENGLLAWLDARSKLLVYGFDSSARRRGSRGPFAAHGDHTNVFRSLRDVDNDLRALPLAAVVMLTDGCRNTGGSSEDAAKLLAARGVPLHIVGVGSPASPRDYEVVRVLAPRHVRRNTEVELQINLRHTGFTQPFAARLVREGNEIVTDEVDPAGDTDLKLVRMSFTPDHRGTATYTVEIPPDGAEKVVENNAREFVLDIRDDRLPVLYIEGSPRLEYRFLRRAMFRDPDFRVVGILRLAKDRFYVQGANDDEGHLKAGFPRKREELFAFQAVILGDIEAGHFSPQQLAMLEEFVQTRGGGLAMLGGVNSFGLGGCARTPVGRMLPLAVSTSDPPHSDARYDPRLTEEGTGHPVMRLSGDPGVNARMWAKAPPLIGITPVRGVKAGASVLLTKPDDPTPRAGPTSGAGASGGRPVLAVQNYGEGRVAAFTSGGSWYWQVSMPAADEFHEKFWKQLIRWLAMGAKQQLTVTTDADIYGQGAPVVIRATVLGKDLRPVNDAEVVATISDPLGNAEEVPMHWTLSREGVYQCRYNPAQAGSFTVSVKVGGWEELKPAVTGFMVSVPMIEFSDSNLKEDTLRRMASVTGGRYYGVSEMTELRVELEKAIASVAAANVRPETKPLWDMPVLYVLLIGLMGAEWLIRRRSGLA